MDSADSADPTDTAGSASRRSPADPQPVILVVEPYGGSIRRHNPALPLVYWDDAAVTRGDGVFETLLVRKGRAANFKRHARRFLASARLMELPEPDLDKWEEATRQAVESWYAENDGDARCVWTYTRGRASTGHPSAWIVVSAIPQTTLRQRKAGVKVMTAPRGYSINTMLPGVGDATTGTASPTPPSLAPWLTVGAKTLSYAANMAALRHANAHGFDDVIWVEAETGRVLEGATSSVVTVKKGGRLRTPTPGGDILPGTTQAALFGHARRQGWRCKEKDLYVDDLLRAESVWLVSSVRMGARVTALDGRKLPAPDNEAEIRRLIADALAR
ncbi:aminodeoxychorismate lyase [Corynebacterium halotolerans]|uniref:4-amino-4-deoxychorismate lyase n=1 Tax=Corynebacterium halotolerans YIM 70093 = DSM 44683 TaxID=1121362 RepID=M1P0Q8_9CORY|nr:aminodeoxychorismate lyase [Corynebacterium halotolerans]AGF73365.1 4-amino-4-deoxychorismate lyase [Corynebacterium halotolerans YIM 70093 = DSM 44683]